MNHLVWLTQRSCQANIAKFFAFRFIWEFQLFLPIWVIFVQQKHGFSLTQVTLLNVAFWLTMAAGEIPTGAVADAFGRKRSLLIAVMLAAASVSFFVLAPTYPLLMLANTLWALAMTFDSGAALALLYDSLRALGREGEYPRLRGRLAVVVHLAAALSSVLGGLLGAFDLALPFLGYAALLVASLSLVSLLQEPPQEAGPITDKQLSYAQTLQVTTQALRLHATLRYALLFSNIIPLATVMVGITLLQPHALALGVPVAAMGFVSLGLRGVRMAGSSTSFWCATRWGEGTWLRTVSVLVFAGMMGLGLLNSLWGIAFFALVGFASSAAIPVVENEILRQVPGSVRATILSVDSLIFRLLLAIVEPVMGWLGDTYGLPVAFLALGVMVGSSLLVILVLWSQHQGAPPQAMPESA